MMNPFVLFFVNNTFVYSVSRPFCLFLTSISGDIHRGRVEGAPPIEAPEARWFCVNFFYLDWR